ncbi:hypothetical protein FOXYSP1_10359 [Fusarium oxysporum f. sp. phaseoli]
MKFSTVSTLFLTQGIIAMPWFSAKSKAAGDEITPRIEISEGSFHLRILPTKKALPLLAHVNAGLLVLRRRNTIPMDEYVNADDLKWDWC